MHLFALLLAIASSSSALAETSETPVAIQEGSIEQLVCITSGSLQVRSDSLNSVLFSAKRGDAVKSFQGWGDVQKKKVVDGKTFTYVKLQFPERNGKGVDIGWVADEYIKTKAECPGMAEADPIDPERSITGINDPNCCTFPLGNRPLVTYTSGVASFGSSRSGGKRKHAASDLYRNKGDPIRAVAEGQVIRGLYFFYQGTYAIELKHSGGFVVRYGEVGSKSVVASGKTVKAGQTVGFMGKTNCCKPMLHFELYSGAKSGSLTGSGPYQRRSDLMSPTKYLQKWQDDAFRDQR